AQAKSSLKEAIIAGTGSIKATPVVVAGLDFSFMGGSMGGVGGGRAARSGEVALETHRPLLVFTSSGGARMHEGAVSLMQMAKTCGAISRLRAARGVSVFRMSKPPDG